MKKDNEKKHTKAKTFFADLGYCFNISWKSSKLYTVCRLFLQISQIGLLPILSLYMIKAILDILVSNTQNTVNEFIVYILIYLVILISTRWVSKLDDYFKKVHEEIIENYIMRDILDKSSKIDLRYFDSPEYYNRLQLMKINTMAVKQIIWNGVTLVGSSISFIAAFIILYQVSPLFSCIIVLSYFPIAFYDQIYIKKLYNWQIENVGEERKMEYIAKLVTQKIHAKNIRIFGIADYLIDIYVSIWKTWFRNRKSILKKWSTKILLLSTIPEVLTVLILIQTGLLIINGQRSIGDFSLYSGMVGQLITNVFLISYAVSQITENKLRIEDFKEFQDWSNIVEGTGEMELKSIQTIKFENVSFIYPGNDNVTIKNLSVAFHSKEKIALVGINGAGKTTLIKLLLRFYDVTEGAILINGVNIKNYTPNSIRRAFSVMFQDYSNYAFTLKENIRLSDIGKGNIENEILQACQKSGVDKILSDWEEGLETYLNREFVKEGKELSEGENQKIALARTFFRDGQIIILDEPSSSLDPESEHLLFNKMIELCTDKGVLLITHRLSNIVLVDRIMVLEKGVLIEEGTHEELMKKNGRYATMFNHQAENYINRSN